MARRLMKRGTVLSRRCVGQNVSDEGVVIQLNILSCGSYVLSCATTSSKRPAWSGRAS